MSANETIADIVKEMRMSPILNWRTPDEVFREIADRLEVAAKEAK